MCCVSSSAGESCGSYGPSALERSGLRPKRAGPTSRSTHPPLSVGSCTMLPPCWSGFVSLPPYLSPNMARVGLCVRVPSCLCGCVFRLPRGCVAGWSLSSAAGPVAPRRAWGSPAFGLDGLLGLLEIGFDLWCGFCAPTLGHRVHWPGQPFSPYVRLVTSAPQSA